MISKTSRVLISGAFGQDGSFLAKALQERGSTIIGGTRNLTPEKASRWRRFADPGEQVSLIDWDITDAKATLHVLEQTNPDYIFNLAGLSSVSACEINPNEAFSSNVLGLHNILEGIRNVCPSARLFQAGSSEIYGLGSEEKVNEKSPFHPLSLYGICKLTSYKLVQKYRDEYGLDVRNGILFNHESHLRPEGFVSSKIVRDLLQHSIDGENVLKIGRLEIERDWGHAHDFVKAMILIAESDKPDDFVVATGKLNSIQAYIEQVAEVLEMHVDWSGDGVQLVGKNRATGKLLVQVDKKFYRTERTNPLVGDIQHLQRVTGWEPQFSFQELISNIVSQHRDYPRTDI